MGNTGTPYFNSARALQLCVAYSQRYTPEVAEQAQMNRERMASVQH